MSTKTKISYRRHDWLDTKSRQAKFGIQAKAVGFEARWMHCTRGSKPMLFDTEAERDAELKKLRKEQRDTQPPTP